MLRLELQLAGQLVVLLYGDFGSLCQLRLIQAQQLSLCLLDLIKHVSSQLLSLLNFLLLLLLYVFFMKPLLILKLKHHPLDLLLDLSLADSEFFGCLELLGNDHELCGLLHDLPVVALVQLLHVVSVNVLQLQEIPLHAFNLDFKVAFGLGGQFEVLSVLLDLTFLFVFYFFDLFLDAIVLFDNDDVVEVELENLVLLCENIVLFVVVLDCDHFFSTCLNFLTEDD